jgi:hypothetical protein
MVAAWRACQQRIDAGHFAGEDRVPALEKLRVRQGDAERGAQRLEEFGIAGVSGLVTPEDLALPKRPGQIGRRTAGMPGPACQHLAEVDIDDHAAKIEQQRVGDAGTKLGFGHCGRLRKSARSDNGSFVRVTPLHPATLFFKCRFDACARR